MSAKKLSTWRVIFALVQLESVIALVAGVACVCGHLSGATLATILVGLLGTSRVPAAVRVARGELPPHDDDEGPPTQRPSSKPRGRGPGVVITSCLLTFFLGLASWRTVLERRSS